MMEDQTFICRFCLTEQGESVNLFEHYVPSEKVYLYQLVSQIFGLKILKDDGTTDKICLGCLLKTYETFFFRRKCLSSEKALLKKQRTSHNISLVQEWLANKDNEMPVPKGSGYAKDILERKAEKGSPSKPLVDKDVSKVTSKEVQNIHQREQAHTDCHCHLSLVNDTGSVGRKKFLPPNQSIADGTTDPLCVNRSQSHAMCTSQKNLSPFEIESPLKSQINMMAASSTWSTSQSVSENYQERNSEFLAFLEDTGQKSINKGLLDLKTKHENSLHGKGGCLQAQSFGLKEDDSRQNSEIKAQYNQKAGIQTKSSSALASDLAENNHCITEKIPALIPATAVNYSQEDCIDIGGSTKPTVLRSCINRDIGRGMGTYDIDSLNTAACEDTFEPDNSRDSSDSIMIVGEIGSAKANQVMDIDSNYHSGFFQFLNSNISDQDCAEIKTQYNQKAGIQTKSSSALASDLAENNHCITEKIPTLIPATAVNYCQEDCIDIGGICRNRYVGRGIGTYEIESMLPAAACEDTSEPDNSRDSSNSIMVVGEIGSAKVNQVMDIDSNYNSGFFQFLNSNILDQDCVEMVNKAYKASIQNMLILNKKCNEKDISYNCQKIHQDEVIDANDKSRNNNSNSLDNPAKGKRCNRIPIKSNPEIISKDNYREQINSKETTSYEESLKKSINSSVSHNGLDTVCDSDAESVSAFPLRSLRKKTSPVGEVSVNESSLYQVNEVVGNRSLIDSKRNLSLLQKGHSSSIGINIKPEKREKKDVTQQEVNKVIQEKNCENIMQSERSPSVDMRKICGKEKQVCADKGSKIISDTEKTSASVDVNGKEEEKEIKPLQIKVKEESRLCQPKNNEDSGRKRKCHESPETKRAKIRALDYEKGNKKETLGKNSNVSNGTGRQEIDSDAVTSLGVVDDECVVVFVGKCPENNETCSKTLECLPKKSPGRRSNSVNEDDKQSLTLSPVQNSDACTIESGKGNTLANSYTDLSVHRNIVCTHTNKSFSRLLYRSRIFTRWVSKPQM